MLNEMVQDALNQQINTEFASSYAYLGMSAFCEHISFPGFANWLSAQSAEEYGHGMKLYKFMLARHGRVELRELPAPQTDFGSIPEVFQDALQQEIEVSKRIDALYDLAMREKAFATLVELEWFIKEQVEEERTFRTIVSKLELGKNDPSALMDLDREMSSRSR